MPAFRPTLPVISTPLVRGAAIQLVVGVALGLPWMLLGQPAATAFALAHGALAATLAVALGEPWWWRLIHAAFVPLLYAASLVALPPVVSLGIFLALVLIFGGITRTRVPLFLSSPACARVLGQMLDGLTAPRAADLGCGTGGVLRGLAELRPDVRLDGFELAPASWLIARWRVCDHAGTRVIRGDFMQRPWVDYDLVYVFLSPVAMDAVGRKACAEMRPGALLVSNSFPIDTLEPVAILELPDRRRTHLYVYRPGSSPGHAHDKWPIPRAFRATADASATG